MRSNTVVALVIAAGVLTAGSALSARQAAKDACSLLTQSQISAVLGVQVGPGQPLAPTAHAPCGWTRPGGDNSKRVVLDLMAPIGRLSPVDRFEAGKKPMEGITKEPVTGIGDDAYYITTPGFGTGLNVKKGAAAFQVRVYGFPLSEIKAKEKTLALNVIAKL